MRFADDGDGDEALSVVAEVEFLRLLSKARCPLLTKMIVEKARSCTYPLI